MNSLKNLALVFGITSLLMSCDLNRSAKAQRQEYRKLPKKGPDYVPVPLQLKRERDYFLNEMNDEILKKMRQR